MTKIGTPKIKINLIFAGLAKAHNQIYALADIDMLEDKSGSPLLYPLTLITHGGDSVITVPKHLSITHKHTRISYSLLAAQLGLKPATLNQYINCRSSPPIVVFSHLLDVLGLSFGDICALWSKTEEELKAWWDWFRHEDLWRYQIQGQRSANNWEALVMRFNDPKFKREHTLFKKGIPKTMPALIKICYFMAKPPSWANVTDYFSLYSPRTTPDASHAITGRPWDTATHEQAAKDFEYRLAKLGKRL